MTERDDPTVDDEVLRCMVGRAGYNKCEYVGDLEDPAEDEEVLRCMLGRGGYNKCEHVGEFERDSAIEAMFLWAVCFG